MDRITIRGGNRLHGRLPISGAKNAALTLLPCSLLSDEPLTLTNLPRLADVDSFGHLLNELGVSTTVSRSRRVSPKFTKSLIAPIVQKFTRFATAPKITASRNAETVTITAMWWTSCIGKLWHGAVCCSAAKPSGDRFGLHCAL